MPLLLDVIRIVQPSHIIQFNYTSQENTNKNLPALTEDFLMNTPGWAFVVDDEKNYSDSQRSEELSVITFWLPAGINLRLSIKCLSYM